MEHDEVSEEGGKASCWGRRWGLQTVGSIITEAWEQTSEKWESRLSISLLPLFPRKPAEEGGQCGFCCSNRLPIRKRDVLLLTFLWHLRAWHWRLQSLWWRSLWQLVLKSGRAGRDLQKKEITSALEKSLVAHVTLRGGTCKDVSQFLTGAILFHKHPTRLTSWHCHAERQLLHEFRWQGKPVLCLYA